MPELGERLSELHGKTVELHVFAIGIGFKEFGGVFVHLGTNRDQLDWQDVNQAALLWLDEVRKI